MVDQQQPRNQIRQARLPLRGADIHHSRDPQVPRLPIMPPHSNAIRSPERRQQDLRLS